MQEFLGLIFFSILWRLSSFHWTLIFWLILEISGLNFLNDVFRDLISLESKFLLFIRLLVLVYSLEVFHSLPIVSLELWKWWIRIHRGCDQSLIRVFVIIWRQTSLISISSGHLALLFLGIFKYSFLLMSEFLISQILGVYNAMVIIRDIRNFRKYFLIAFFFLNFIFLANFVFSIG